MKKQLSIIVLTLLACLSSVAEAKLALAFQVTLKGTVNTNNTPFTRSAVLYITSTITSSATKNGVNPFDIALVSGNPAGVPNPGSIWYFTNYSLYKLVGGSSVSNSALDLAYVSKSGNCITMKPDSNCLTGLHYSNPSMFTVSSSLFSQLYFVLKGAMQVCSSDGWKTISGSVNFWAPVFTAVPPRQCPIKPGLPANMWAA